MRRPWLYLLLGLIVAALFVLLQLVFVVRAGEMAVVTTFGKITRAVTDPGLYGRWPWPIQSVIPMDNRQHCLEGTFEETYTEDRKNIVLMTYVCWRIADPVLFLQRVGSEVRAEQSLEGVVRNHKNAVIGRHPFRELVNADPQALRLAAMEAEMLDAVRQEVRERYGLEVTALGIRKVNLPEAITEKVFERMRAERMVAADRYRAEGESEAVRIRAEADRKRDELLAAADAKAKTLRAEGDAEAAKAYAVFNENPELAVFLRKLDALEETLKLKSTVVLGTDTAPYDLLKGEVTPPAISTLTNRP